MSILSTIPKPILTLSTIYIGIDGFLLQGFITKNIVMPLIISTVAANPVIVLGGMSTLYAANKLGLLNTQTNHELNLPKADESVKTEFATLIEALCSSDVPLELVELANDIDDFCHNFN